MCNQPDRLLISTVGAMQIRDVKACFESTGAVPRVRAGTEALCRAMKESVGGEPGLVNKLVMVNTDTKQFGT